MILPRGITGFSVPRRHHVANPLSFRTDCWQVVTSLAGRVEDRPQVLAGSLTNFISQVLVLAAGDVTVLLNNVHPWVGFCRPLDPGDCTLEFTDPQPAATAFEALGRYRVLSRAELDQPVTAAMCSELGWAEVKQLKYWSKVGGHSTLRVGEVVFNFWD